MRQTILKKYIQPSLTILIGAVLQVFLNILLAPVKVPPSILLNLTMILQRPRIIVGDAEFEPRTSASEVWHTTYQ